MADQTVTGAPIVIGGRIRLPTADGVIEFPYAGPPVVDLSAISVRLDSLVAAIQARLPAGVIAPALAPSTDGASIASPLDGPLVVGLKAFTLAPSFERGQQVAINGQPDPTTAHIVRLVLLGGALYTLDAGGSWRALPLAGGPGALVPDPTAPAPLPAPLPSAPV